MHHAWTYNIIYPLIYPHPRLALRSNSARILVMTNRTKNVSAVVHVKIGESTFSIKVTKNLFKPPICDSLNTQPINSQILNT